MHGRPKKEQPLHKRASPRTGRLFWILAGVAVLIVAASVGTNAAYAALYKDRFLPNVSIGMLPVGGKTIEEAERALQTKIDELFLQGFLFEIDDQRATLSPLVLSPDDPDLSRELIAFDAAGARRRAFGIGRGPNPFLNLFEIYRAYERGITIPVEVHIDLPEFESVLTERFKNFLTPATDARLRIDWPTDASAPTILVEPEAVGTTFDAPGAGETLIAALQNLERPQIELSIVPALPRIMRPEAATLVPQVATLLERGPWKITHDTGSWDINAQALGSFLMIRKDEARPVALGLGGDALASFFGTIAERVERGARDAKFAMENGRVIEFHGSQTGVAIDREATRVQLENALLRGTAEEIQLVTATTEPTVTTAEVNTLGIEGMLGVGISNFSGSPPNRIKNIKNAARILNGLLIKPDEEFSLVAALEPFTLENGYLPELVIKGDKIEPEIGGGLCQIGTTTFRAAMNSATPITERQNHSLVVRYYNDPSNGNPGTDATIYGPHPDFRFKNDTGAHMLLTTEVDLTSFELRFTFWGKSDGRKGSYSAPIVHRWIPAGEMREVKTTDLAPGERKCQSKYVGAETSFVYTIERPDGTKEETTYTSHYRPLPEICLVGVAPTESGAETGAEAETLTPTEAADVTVN